MRLYPKSLIALFYLIACFCPSQTARGQAVFSTEYDIKAALLFNLSQFTEWPSTAFAEPSSPIVIGVLGNNPFGPGLEKVVSGETVQGRNLTVRFFENVEEISCHILFVSRSESSSIDRLLPKLRRRGILLVSDIDRFARRGGMIRFATERNRVRLVINNREVEAAGLKISSKILRIAELVETQP